MSSLLTLASPPGKRQSQPAEYLILSGAAGPNGSGPRLDPVYRLESSIAPLPLPDAGEWCLELAGGGGLPSRHCVDENLDGGEFVAKVPYRAGTQRISLTQMGQEVIARAASANAPSLQITSPTAGANLDASAPLTITWMASDADDDGLVFAVLQSADGGESWFPLTFDLTDAQFTFDSAQIQGGGDVFFRVLASDGFHTTEQVVGPVTVTQRPALQVDDRVRLGSAAVGQPSEGFVTVTGAGTGPVVIEAVTSDSPGFGVDPNTLPLTLLVGMSRKLFVEFTPSGVGVETAMLTLTTNSPDQPNVNVLVEAEGLDPAGPILDTDLTGESFNFGRVGLGQASPTPIFLMNRGAAELNAEFAIEGEGFGIANGTAALRPEQARQNAFTLGENEHATVTLSFEPSSLGESTGRLVLTTNDPAHARMEFALSGVGVEIPPTPMISAGGVVDAAQFQPVVARGGIGSIFGGNLADGVALASGVPLPLDLGGTRVRVDGREAPLFFVSPNQINYQVPFEVSSPGTAGVVVIRNGEESPPETVPVADYAPEVFLNPNTGEPIIQRHPDGALITAANPAQPGDVLIIFVTGIGDVSNPPPSGAAALGSPLATANLTPTVTVGGARSQVFFAGLAPFFVGLGQVNIQLPVDFAQTAALRSGAAQGATLPLVIAFGESRSQAVNLPIAGVTVQPGRIDVGPVGLDFGDVNVGQSGNGTLTVRNVGAGSLTVNSINTDNARFAVVSPPTPFTVPPGAQRMITLSFQPTAAGRVDASALIGSDDPLNPAVTIPLLGHGVGGSAAGSLSVSTASLAFGSVNLGQSADLSLTLSNTGGAELTVNTIMSSDPQFSTVFAGSPSGTPFTLAAGAQLTIAVRFQPGSAGVHNATLSLSSNDTASPIVNISLTGEGAGGGGIGGAPSLTLNSNSVSYGGVTVGRTNELTLIVTNGGGNPLTVESITSSDPQFRAASPETPFAVPVGGQQNVKIHFTPSSLGSHSGTLTFSSNDPAQPAVEVAVSGSGAAGAHIQFSDSFDRPDASCSPAPADNALGGGGRHGYLPLFISRGRPLGARLASGALENPGMNYAGVQFSGDEQPCFGGEGEDIGQDVNIRVDLLVPGDNDGNITQAGPYFRTRSATPGSSILGGMSAGYWVQLHSTGQIKLKLLNPEATVAATRTPAAFDNTVMHTVEVSMRRDRLWVALDGVLQVFDQDDTRVISVPIPAVWEIPPAVGENEGAAGIAFGAEDNPNQIGGQRADNLVVTDYESLTELPVQE